MPFVCQLPEHPVAGSSLMLCPQRLRVGSGSAERCYAQAQPKPVADQAISRLVDQRAQPRVVRVTATAWHTVASTYILTEQDASLAIDLQNRMATRTATSAASPPATPPSCSGRPSSPRSSTRSTGHLLAVPRSASP